MSAATAGKQRSDVVSASASKSEHTQCVDQKCLYGGTRGRIRWLRFCRLFLREECGVWQERD